jgi:hypothetical protein
LMPCVLSFQATLPKASVFIWKVHPVTTLVTETACLCSSAFMASCKLLANITCSVVKFIRKLVWSNFRLMSVSLPVMSPTSLGLHRSRMRICLSK